MRCWRIRLKKAVPSVLAGKGSRRRRTGRETRASARRRGRWSRCYPRRPCRRRQASSGEMLFMKRRRQVAVVCSLAGETDKKMGLRCGPTWSSSVGEEEGSWCPGQTGEQLVAELTRPPSGSWSVIGETRGRGSIRCGRLRHRSRRGPGPTDVGGGSGGDGFQLTVAVSARLPWRHGTDCYRVAGNRSS